MPNPLRTAAQCVPRRDRDVIKSAGGIPALLKEALERFRYVKICVVCVGIGRLFFRGRIPQSQDGWVLIQTWSAGMQKRLRLVLHHMNGDYVTEPTVRLPGQTGRNIIWGIPFLNERSRASVSVES